MPGKATSMRKSAKKSVKTAKKNLLPAFDRVARDVTDVTDVTDAESRVAKVARPACMGDDVATARACHAAHDA